MSGERGGPAKACSPWETISSSWCWAWSMSSAFQRRDWLVSTAFCLWYNVQPRDGKFDEDFLTSSALWWQIWWQSLDIMLSLVMAQWWLYVEPGQCHRLSRDSWVTIFGNSRFMTLFSVINYTNVSFNCIVQAINGDKVSDDVDHIKSAVHSSNV